MHTLAALALLTVALQAPVANPYTEAALLASPRLGPYATQDRSPRGFSPRDPFVLTYYFFWYDIATGAHFSNPDGSDALSHHPVSTRGMSWLNPGWHRKELLDIMDAGIDVILPVSWSAPCDKVHNFPHHDNGIPPLVQAWDRLAREGRRPPRIGMFYDTSSLSGDGNVAHVHVDASTDDGKAWMYVTIRDFFSQVPARMRAAINGKPIVYLYSAGSAKGGQSDPGLFPYIRRHFRKDFGVDPLIAAERSWRCKADFAYDWGAAYRAKSYLVAAVGPGYDDRVVPGRISPVREREGGKAYSRDWQLILSQPVDKRPKQAIIETWNELHEGTDICETREYGRTYINLTRRYARLWRAGKRMAPPGGRASSRSAELRTDGTLANASMRLVNAGDGLFRVAEAAGSPCIETVGKPREGDRYLYVDLAENRLFEVAGPVEVTVEYLDDQGPLYVDYDSTDISLDMAGSYKASNRIQRGGSGAWRSVTFHLPDARFANRQNHFTDLRIGGGADPLRVRRIAVTAR